MSKKSKQPPRGSVIKCDCGCKSVHIRAQDGNWIHAESIKVGDPFRDKTWFLEGWTSRETHTVLHEGFNTNV